MNNYLKFPSILLAVGFCNSGKTVSITYTIKTCQAWDFIIIISNTAEFNGDYEFLKDLGIKHRIYNASKITEILATIIKIQETNLKSGNIQNLLIVCDDVMGSLNNSDTFKKLASIFRHLKITIFMTTQYVSNSTTYIRELANYIFCFDQRTEASKKAVYMSYFNDIGTFNDFKKLFSGLKPFQFFFIDRVGKKRFKFMCPFEKKIDKPEESKEKKIFKQLEDF